VKEPADDVIFFSGSCWLKGRQGMGHRSGVSMARKKQKREPKFVVDIALRAQDLAKAGYAVSFKVKGPDGKLGTIELGQGAFMWKGAGDHNRRRIPWNTFFAMLERSK
jgi:hypothetical protein